MSLRRFTIATAIAALVAAGLTAASPQAQAATAVPRFDHIVLVMFENKANSQITSSSAPYFTALAAQGGEVQPVVRDHPPEPAQLHRAVLRRHAGRDQ